MKSSQIVIPTVTGVLGLALGIAMAPSVRTAETGNEAPSAVIRSRRHQSAELDGISGEESRKTATPSRVRDRGEEKKPSEPRVSIPLQTIVEILKENMFKHASTFSGLQHSMDRALSLLGATDREREEIKDVVMKSQAEIYAAEKAHFKLGEVTAEQIHIDMSGMQGPAAEIAKRTQDGIRAALPPDMAEGLVSAIDWENYYPVDQASAATLEITRSSSGKLTAREKYSHAVAGKGIGGVGYGMGSEFKDDGTPLPADRVFKETGFFGERWAPFLKGLTLLPKNED